MSATGRDFSPAWRLTAALACLHFSSSMDRHVVSLILPPLKAELGLSDTLLGLLHGTAYTLLYAVAIIPFGIFVDRVNRRALAAAAALLWSVGTCAFAFADDFAGLFAARLLVGLGQAALIPAAISLIADSFPGGQLGRPIGLFTSASALGRAMALIGGGLILAWLATGALDLRFILGDRPPWRAMLLVSLVVNAVVLAFLMTTKEPTRRERHAPATARILGWVLDNRRAYVSIFVGASSAILLIQSLAAWTPTLLVRRFALSTAESGMLAGLVVVVGGPLGNIAGGFLLDRLEGRGVTGAPGRVMAAALAGAALTGPLVSLVPDLAVTVGGLILASFLLGIATPAGLAGIQGLTPESLRGKVTAAFVSGVTLVSLGTGPLLVGWMSESLFSGENSLSLSLLVLITAASAAGGLAAYPRPDGRSG